MNKPKFKVGDKVMWDDRPETASTITKVVPDDDFNYLYTVDKYRKNSGFFEEFTEDYLQLVEPKEKRLEYGYCEIRDIIVDKDGDERMILDVRERLVSVSPRNNFTTYGSTFTYEQIEVSSYTVKQDTPQNDIVELTLEEIAELKGISVDKLRIKE
jgi:hypothetical protein